MAAKTDTILRKLLRLKDRGRREHKSKYQNLNSETDKLVNK